MLKLGLHRFRLSMRLKGLQKQKKYCPLPPSAASTADTYNHPTVHVKKYTQNMEKKNKPVSNQPISREVTYNGALNHIYMYLTSLSQL